ncbi:molybdopterin-dependent oxidoreductase [Photobacterium leiognathi]|uniref:molybdopterin-dependent oxidoreductase n=1 Tax=Photobacterium leiognathi TaxID=553611 RepID=UPI002739D259|nr:molybdopterin-dependent oxidoreductase [Photobacterium leiognathi]
MVLSRRDFLKKTCSVSTKAALAMQLSPLAFASQTDPNLQRVLTGSKFGTFEAELNGNTIKAINVDNIHSKMVYHAYKTINNPSRIKTPMVRKGYLSGDNSDRGSNEFVPISWEKAIDILYKEIDNAQSQHGPSSIFPLSHWGMFGQFGNCGTAMQRALNLHGKTMSSTGFYSFAAAESILPEIVGDIEVTSEQTTLNYVAEHTELLILWGCDPIKNLKIGFSVPDFSPYKYWQQIKQKIDQGKIEVISIDPVTTDTQNYLNAKNIAIKPHTDTALMLGLCYELLEQETYNKRFIEDYTDGHEEFFAYLLGEKDGVKKTAEWASEICGLPVTTIKSLAKKFTTKRTLLSSGWSAQRAEHGEHYCWSLVALASMIGEIGLPGGGFSFGYNANDAGAATSNGSRLGVMSATVKDSSPKYDKPYTSTPYFPTSRMVDVINNPGKVVPFKGKDITYPDLKVFVVAGANPLSTHQDVNQLKQALNKLDFIATIDCQWTATCRFSDLVLPTTTVWERDELIPYGNATNRGVIGMKKLVEPMYESKDDYEIWRLFAAKFDREKQFTEGKTQIQWLKEFYDKAYTDNQKRGINMPVFEKFWTQDNAIFEYPGQNDFVRYADFKEDPDLDGLATDSGLIQLFSQKIANANLKDCPPYPSWMETSDWKERSSGEFFHLVTLHPTNRLHSQLCGVKELRDLINANQHEPLWINPADAKEFNLVTGDIVETYNAKGKVLLGAIVSDKVSQGVLATQEGGWYSPDGDTCLYGNANILTTDRGASSWSQGPSAQTCLVKIKKYQGSTPNIDCFDGPKIVKG